MKSIDLLLKAKHEVGGTSMFIFTHAELQKYVYTIVQEAWEKAAEKKYSPHKN
jgi:uncharacterized integral membrane protein